jgi:hypothetical protein
MKEKETKSAAKKKKNEKRESLEKDIRILRQSLCLLIFSLLLFMPSRAEGKGRVRAFCMSGGSEFQASAIFMREALMENKSTRYRQKEADFQVYVGDAKTSIKTMNQRLDRIFGSSRAGDLNIFYFTGHGYSASKTEKSRLSDIKGFVIGRSGSQAVIYPYRKLAAKLSGYKGKTLAVIDSCFSQAFYLNGVRKLSKAHRQKLTLMLSSSWKEASYATVLGRGSYISIFTYYFLDAIGFWNTYDQPDCDNDGDGYASVREIYSTLKVNLGMARGDMTPCLYLSAGGNIKLFA